MGMPAGMLPVTKVREDEQHYESQNKDPNTQEAIECMVCTASLPLTAQIVSLPYQYEKCLRLFKHVEALMSSKPLLKC